MEPTIHDLQAQVDRLSLAVHQARETKGQFDPATERLAELTERCSQILKGWTDTDLRHARAVGEVETRLSEWAAIENRLQRDSVQRLRELQTAIEHEWLALREVHEEPVRQLREQAAALVSLQEQIGRLSQDVQLALAEVRHPGSPATAVTAPVAPFPLEGVMRIHEELRDAGAGAQAPTAISLPDVSTALQAAPARGSETALALIARLDTLEREVTAEREQVRQAATLADRFRRNWRWAVGTGGAALVVVAALGLILLQYVNTSLSDAATRVSSAQQQAEAAAQAATETVATTRADASRLLAEASEAARKAEIMSGVLAAPDLVRYTIVSGDQADRGFAQVLWSRSRGVVLSGTRIAPPPTGQTYQLWLLTGASVVSAGVFTPDAAGRATLAVLALPALPRGVIGVSATLEPTGGSPAPTGPIVLARTQS